MRTAKLIHKINNAEPFAEETPELVKELFTGGFGERSMVNAPIYINLAENIHIGNNVIIMPYFKCMSAGSVVTKDVKANTVVAGNPAKFIKEI